MTPTGYSEDALIVRLAITNAVMHRDWFIEGANVFVEIFTDRIEVSSPGGLPKGMLLADLGQKSVRRNPLIADLLHRIAFIEKAGTGIKRMREGATEQGYPEPEFSAAGFFTAVFQPIPAVNEHDTPEESPPKYPASTPQVTPQVTKQVFTILRVAMREASAADLQSALRLNDRVHFLKKYLEPTLEKGLIERTIPDKPRSLYETPLLEGFVFFLFGHHCMMQLLAKFE